MLTDTPFLESLKAGPLVSDGAMGSQLYERGYFITRSFDEANLSRPDLVLQIHREYVEAGAHVIESNTFGANRELLSRYGAQDRVRDINMAGVRLAREAAGREGRHKEGLELLRISDHGEVLLVMSHDGYQNFPGKS